MIGIIGGTLFRNSSFLASAKSICITTEYGKAEVIKTDEAAFINRHGLTGNIPPHKICHAANIKALQILGIKYVIGACSAGSMKKHIRPGSVIIPSDYINLWNISTVFNDKIRHIAPGLSLALREKLIKASKEVAPNIIEEGIYFQSTGPRFETKAEISMMSHFADIVGMTMGQEADAAAELGMEYAGICSVDNYANGVAKENISENNIRELAKENGEKIKRIILNVTTSS